MTQAFDIVVVGSGNAALCAAIAATEKGAKVLVIEKASPDLGGGNTAYTAGAMRFVYERSEDLTPLLTDPEDPRLGCRRRGRFRPNNQGRQGDARSCAAEIELARKIDAPPFKAYPVTGGITFTYGGG